VASNKIAQPAVGGNVIVECIVGHAQSPRCRVDFSVTVIGGS
jgi:hypothetical protein